MNLNTDRVHSMSDLSVQTMPELNRSRRRWFKVLFVLILISNAIIGACIIADRRFYFSPSYQMQAMDMLVIFVFFYMLIFITAFIMGFVLSLVIFCIYKITCKKERQNGEDRIILGDDHKMENNEIQLNQENENYFLEEEDSFNIISYVFALFIIMIIFLYICAIPWGIYLIFQLKYNEIMRDHIRFFLVYFFISLNIFMGLAVVFAGIFILIGIHIKISGRQKDFKLDEEYLKRVEKEVDQAYGKKETKVGLDSNIIINDK